MGLSFFNFSFYFFKSILLLHQKNKDDTSTGVGNFKRRRKPSGPMYLLHEKKNHFYWLLPNSSFQNIFILKIENWNFLKYNLWINPLRDDQLSNLGHFTQMTHLFLAQFAIW
jgi:hypothetical protein